MKYILILLAFLVGCADPNSIESNGTIIRDSDAKITELENKVKHLESMLATVTRNLKDDCDQDLANLRDSNQYLHDRNNKLERQYDALFSDLRDFVWNYQGMSKELTLEYLYGILEASAPKDYTVYAEEN